MNKRTFGQLREPGEWKRYLRDPDKHWQTGKSAKTLAHCWHEQSGFPACVKRVLKASTEFGDVQLLLSIPEYVVELPGKGFGSQNDIMVWAKSQDVNMCIAVEGKVDEGFGESVSQWLKSGTGKNSKANRELRFDALCSRLNILGGFKESIKDLPYQLLHRAASAVITAEEFGFNRAAMLIHSFDDPDTLTGFSEYARFVGCFDFDSIDKNQVYGSHKAGGVDLYFVWVNGDREWTLA